jgi:hypothetical protein
MHYAGSTACCRSEAQTVLQLHTALSFAVQRQRYCASIAACTLSPATVTCNLVLRSVFSIAAMMYPYTLLRPL